jgi:hypothetical protein
MAAADHDGLSAATISHRTSRGLAKEDATIMHGLQEPICESATPVADPATGFSLLYTTVGRLLPSPGFTEISLFSRGAARGDLMSSGARSGRCQGTILRSIFGVLPTWVPPSLPRAAITSPLPDVDASIRFCSHLPLRMNHFNLFLRNTRREIKRMLKYIVPFMLLWTMRLLIRLGKKGKTKIHPLLMQLRTHNRVKLTLI